MALEKSYYDALQPSSLGGVNRLIKGSKKNKKTVLKWLSGQDTYTLHKPVRRNFKRRRVITGGIGYQYEIDLVDLRKFSEWNDGMNYILMCIDVFSKKGFAEPIKTKKSPSIIPALKRIFQERKPMYISFDSGGEFVSAVMKDFFRKEGIFSFAYRNENTKAATVERYNRTILSRLYRYFTYARSYRYLDILPKIIESYNHSYHRSIKTSPNNVTKENESKIWHTLYDDLRFAEKIKPVFVVGDTVRLARKRGVFDKGYTEQWTEELFTISQVHLTNPPVYSVKDFKNEEILGRFYAQELQKVENKKEFLIEKILGSRKQGRRKEVLVKWVGYDKSFNSYIPASEVKHISTR